MAASRSPAPAHIAGAILRCTGIVVSAPVLTRSRRNAASALHQMQHRHSHRAAGAEIDGVDPGLAVGNEATPAPR